MASVAPVRPRAQQPTAQPVEPPSDEQRRIDAELRAERLIFALAEIQARHSREWACMRRHYRRVIELLENDLATERQYWRAVVDGSITAEVAR